jgi:hypothetical protein
VRGASFVAIVVVAASVSLIGAATTNAAELPGTDGQYAADVPAVRLAPQ